MHFMVFQLKGGQCNIKLKHVHNKRRSFFKDIFTTAVDSEWRYTLLSFATAFFVSWLVFAILYWFVAYVRGDLETDNLPNGKNQDSGHKDHNATNAWKPCVWEIYDFTSCYLFSVETQHTIG